MTKQARKKSARKQPQFIFENQAFCRLIFAVQPQVSLSNVIFLELDRSLSAWSMQTN